MTSLLLACAFFFGIHVFIAGSPLRAALVAAMGERAYRAAFSVASIVGLYWTIHAYQHAAFVPLWSTADWWRWPALMVTLLAVALVFIGLTTPNPTTTGAEHRLERGDAVHGIVRVTRHPFLWGVALWAGMHVILNGDAASCLLFGMLLVLALLGPFLIDARRRRVYGPAWAQFAAVTSSLPFGAIVAGRNTLRLNEIGAWRLVGALAVYLALLLGHTSLFGVSPFPLG